MKPGNILEKSKLTNWTVEITKRQLKKIFYWGGLADHFLLFQ
jgi:hypothetical protein